MASTHFTKTLTNAELSMFCQQIAMMLNAGISTYEGITFLHDDAETETAKRLYAVLLEELETGCSFHDALSKSEAFPDYVLDMVHLGEMSGRLENVLQSLDRYYQREENLASGIRHALTYPLIMISMMLAVILILITKVLPVFSDVYRQLGSELTGISRTFLQIGDVLGHDLFYVILILIVLTISLLFAYQTHRGRSQILLFANRILFGPKFRHLIAASRFAGGMALSLHSGLNVDQGLELSASLVDDPVMLKQIASCQEAIATGQDLAHALSTTGIFTSMYARMIMIGFKAGSIDTVMDQIAESYEEQVDLSIARFLSILEPTLVILLSFIVGLILLSVLLPLLGIMSGIGY